MFVTCVDETKFVAYAPFDDSILVLTVKYDNEFISKMLSTLKTVYFDFMLPNVGQITQDRAQI